MCTIELEKEKTDEDGTIGTEIEVIDMELTDRDGRAVVGLGAAFAMGRLWIFKGNVLWYSVTSDIYDFATADSGWMTSAGYIEPNKNITPIHPFLGSLAVFYDDSSELLSVDGEGLFSRSEESPGGCAGVHAVVFHDTNLYFYDRKRKAVFSFSQIVTGEKVLGENMAVEIQQEISAVDGNELDKIRTLSVFTEDRNEIWWLIPTEDRTGQEGYSTIFIYDYLKKEWVKRKSQKINAMAVIDGVLYSGVTRGIY